MRKIICSTSGFKMDLDTALGKIAGMGFDGIDLICIGGWNHVVLEELVNDFDRVAQTVEDLLRKHGLTAYAANAGLPTLHQRADETVNAQRREQAEALCRLMQRLRIPYASCYPGYYGPGVEENDPREHDRILDDLASSAVEVSEIFLKHDLRFAVEPHWRTPIQTLEQTWSLVSRDERIMLVYDPTHFVMQGVPTAETLPMLERSSHAHLRDAAKDAMAVPFGAGDVDFQAILDVMRDRDFTASISLEYLPDKVQDTEADLVKMRDALEAMKQES